MKKNLLAKKILATILTVSASFSLFATTACIKPKTVNADEYPSIETANVDNDDTDTKDTDNEDDLPNEDDAVKAPVDTLRVKGEFEFNPTAIHPAYLECIKDNPKIVTMSKCILQSIYDVEDTVDLSSVADPTSAEFKIALDLAEFSSPIVSTVYIEYSDMEDIKIIYFPKESDGESEDSTLVDGYERKDVIEIYDNFRIYITDTINNNLTDENTDLERAEIIMREMVDKLTLYYPPEDEDSLEEEEMSAEEWEMYQITLVESVSEGNISDWALIELYQFFMTQLNIKSLIVGCQGGYQPQGCETLDDIMKMRGGWAWNVVTVEDDKSYICDLIFEKIYLDDQRKTVEDYEPELKYFGMSDKKRDESFQVYYKRVMFAITPTKTIQVPVCEKNYND